MKSESLLKRHLNQELLTWDGRVSEERRIGWTRQWMGDAWEGKLLVSLKALWLSLTFLPSAQGLSHSLSSTHSLFHPSSHGQRQQSHPRPSSETRGTNHSTPKFPDSGGFRIFTPSPSSQLALTRSILSNHHSAIPPSILTRFFSNLNKPTFNVHESLALEISLFWSPAMSFLLLNLSKPYSPEPSSMKRKKERKKKKITTGETDMYKNSQPEI